MLGHLAFLDHEGILTAEDRRCLLKRTFVATITGVQDRGEDQPLPSAAPSQPQASVGDEIKADVVRLVTEDGASRELTLLEALHEAQRSGKALVQVSQPEKSSGGTLVVCKLVTHIEVASAAPSGVRARKGAWKEAGGDAKKEQGNGAKSMQFSMTTSDHDKATKLNRVVGFLNAGKAVRIVVKTSVRALTL